MRTVGAKLDNSEYDIFEFCCGEKGLTKSEMIRTLIQDFVDPQKDDTLVKPVTQATIKRVSYDGGKTWIDIPELTNVTVSD